MSEASRKLRINYELDHISNRMDRGFEHKSLDLNGITIMPILDRLDREYFISPDSIYSLIDSCNREEILNYISSLNAESVYSCIGQMQKFFLES